VDFVCRQRRAHAEIFSVEENIRLVGLDVRDLSVFFARIVPVEPSMNVLTILSTARLAYGREMFAVLGTRLGTQG